VYRSQVSIPANILGPTTYRMIFRAAIQGQERLSVSSGVTLVFNVKKSDRYFRAYLGTHFHGKLALRLDWKTEEIEGA